MKKIMKKQELQEVFRILPAYKKVSPKRKKKALVILKQWLENELNNLKK